MTEVEEVAREMTEEAEVEETNLDKMMFINNIIDLSNNKKLIVQCYSRKEVNIGNNKRVEYVK